QVLAVLDDSVLRSQFRQAQAALAQAEADFQRQEARLVQAQVNQQATVVDMQRYERLYSQGAISQAQLSDRQVQALTAREGVAVDMASLDGARAAIASKLAEIDGLKTLLAQTVVTAPTAGIIAQRNTTIGDTATAGQPLYSLIEAGELALEITPSQPQLAKLDVGTPVTVSTVDGAGTVGRAQQFEIQSRVSSIDPILDKQRRQATVNIALPTDSAAYNLRPGMFLQAEVVIGQRRSVVVPAAAVINQPDGTSIVFTISERSKGENPIETNVVKANVVEVATRPDQLPADSSAMTPANQVEILSGLSPGSRIVVSGASYLQPDDRVSVVPEGSS
ncbi:MAG: efflux RND transporter periplasmic adaptor subunit, partial [Cyanobacteria bacterium J06555_13]